MKTPKPTPSRGSQAEYVDLLARVLAHAKCPWSMYECITDELLNMANAGGEMGSREYIAYALASNSPSYQSAAQRKYGTAPDELYEPQPEAAPVEPQKPSDRAEANAVQIRIAELKQRCDSLYEPSDEAARFKIEREIYNLERGQSADKWSDTICAGGEQ